MDTEIKQKLVGRTIYVPYKDSENEINFSFALGRRLGFIGIIKDYHRFLRGFEATLKGSEIYKFECDSPLLECRAEGSEREAQERNTEEGRLTYNSRTGLWLFNNACNCQFETRPRLDEKAISTMIPLLPFTRIPEFRKEIEELLDILKNPTVLV